MTPVCSPIRIVATNNGFLRRLNSMESFNMAAKNYVDSLYKGFKNYLFIFTRSVIISSVAVTVFAFA